MVHPLDRETVLDMLAADAVGARAKAAAAVAAATAAASFSFP